MKVRALYINNDGLLQERKAKLTNEGKLVVKFGKRDFKIWDAKDITSTILYKTSMLSLITLFIYSFKKYVPAYFVHPKIKVPLTVDLNVGSDVTSENSGKIAYKYSTAALAASELDLVALDKFLKSAPTEIKMVIMMIVFIAGAIFSWLFLSLV